MLPTLISTKLFIPPARSGLVARTRLGQKIESAVGSGSRLVLVSAPAGSGKTTAVREWVASQDRAVAWYAMDEGDNDPVRFWTYFVAAIERQIPDFGETALAVLQPSQPVPVQSFIAQLINELVEQNRPVVFVLDDYHLIQNPAIHQALAFLMDNQPSLLLMVIVSRSDPPMPLARWRSRRQLVELRAVEMRFTLEETDALLNGVMHLAIPDSDLEVLESQTEGWIAGLQLAALALQAKMAQGTISPTEISSYVREFSGSNRYILDYLVGEVLEQQPEEIRRFLLQTCILERLSGQLCDFLLDGPLPGGDTQSTPRVESSQEMLETLEQANLFLVPLDDQRSWFRYHKLFGDLLRQRAQLVYRDGLKHLHRRAALWYEQNGSASDAIHHGLEAHEWEMVARLVEQKTTVALARGETLTLLGWLDALPDDVVQARPWLCVADAWGNLLTGQLKKAGEFLDLAGKAITQAGTPMDTASAGHIQGHISAIQAYISVYQGDLGRSKAFADQALDLLPEDDLVVRSFVAFTLGGACIMDDDLEGAESAFLHASQVARAGHNIHIAAPSLRVIAQLLEGKGELLQAEAYCQQAIQLAKTRSGRTSPVAADAYGELSDLYFEWNDLLAALDHARTGVELGEQLGNADVLTSAYSRMARLHFVNGDHPAAREWLGKAEDLLAHAHLTPGSGTSTRDVQVRLWAASVDTLALRDWVERHQGLLEEPVVLLNERDVRTMARAFLSLGEPARSLDLLQRHECWSKGCALAGMQIKNLALQALAHQVTGAPEQAVEIVKDALVLTEPGGFVRTFVDEGQEMQAILSRVRLLGSGISRDYIAGLLGAFAAGESADHKVTRGEEAPLPSLLIEPLSDREIEVLRLIADGYSNQQIAGELFISLGTVKAHTANIYRKLDVRSRTQAVAYARDLKLI